MKTFTGPCPCGAGPNYETCCKPFHDGEAKPATAEKLMRSRYSAYVVQNIEYVEQTNDPTSKEGFDREAALEWASTSEWLGLTIVATKEGLSGDESGEVEFKARYQREKEEHTHHEVSLFKKMKGAWFYVDGKDIREPVQRSVPKIGRNEPCACGSGKKYKKCCG